MPRDLVMRSDDRIEQMREETSQDERTAIQAYSHYKGVREVMNKVREVSETRSRYAKKQYDKRVAGPYFSEGDYCFILVDVPAHKFADRYRGPYRVVQKINDWNYVVNVADIEKVISISKMRHYYPNKYSPSLESVIEAEEPEIRSLVVHDPSFHPPTSAERQRAVTKSDSSSEDEDGSDNSDDNSSKSDSKEDAPDERSIEDADEKTKDDAKSSNRKPWKRAESK